MSPVSNYKIPLAWGLSKATKVAAEGTITSLQSGAVSFERTMVLKVVKTPVRQIRLIIASPSAVKFHFVGFQLFFVRIEMSAYRDSVPTWPTPFSIHSL